MRLPGFYHLKAAPHLVTCQELSGAQTSTDAMEIDLWDVNPYHATGGAAGSRLPIGQGEQAPDFETVVDLLHRVDVNALEDRNEWLAVTGSAMQGVAVDRVNDLYAIWQDWNAAYINQETGAANDPAANLKAWNNLITEGTAVRGWGRLHKAATGMTLQAARAMQAAAATPIVGRALLDEVVPPVGAMLEDGARRTPVAMSEKPPAPAVDPTTGFGTMLDPYEQSTYFKGCVMISTEGRILCADNCYRGPTDFNIKYGGKDFIINDSGKPVNDAWKAVIHNQKYRMQQVQFTSFRPMEPQRSVTQDELGRDYVNTYLPATIQHREGDVSPFFNHLTALFPDENDRNHLIAFLAHNIKYPGHKVFWSPLVQGAEGMVKNLIKRLMEHAMGGMFFYQPSARDLAEGGAKFNGWMENKRLCCTNPVRIGLPLSPEGFSLRLL